MSFGEEYSKIYDALYNDKDYGAESDYILKKITQAGSSGGKKLLEIGIGTGRHASLLKLLDRDLEITGVEPSSWMSSKAKSRGFRVIEKNATDALTELKEEKFDFVLALFHVVSYLTESSDLRKFFRNASRVLKPGGVLFFDVWHGPAVRKLGMSTRVKRVIDVSGREIIRLSTASLNVKSSVANVAFDIFVERDNHLFHRIQEIHTMRFFDREEVLSLTDALPFTEVNSEEFLSGQPPSDCTWGVGYLFVKSTSKN